MEVVLRHSKFVQFEDRKGSSCWTCLDLASESRKHLVRFHRSEGKVFRCRILTSLACQDMHPFFQVVDDSFEARGNYEEID